MMMATRGIWLSKGTLMVVAVLLLVLLLMLALEFYGRRKSEPPCEFYS
jgi:hypothetical protein